MTQPVGEVDDTARVARRRRSAVLAAIAALVLVAAAAFVLRPTGGGPEEPATPTAPAAASGTESAAVPEAVTTPVDLHVDPSGSDDGDGSPDNPWATLSHALEQLQPGDRLVVAGGEYRERVQTEQLTPGRPDARITVVAAEGERPVVRGLLWLKRPSFWTLDGINVTWDDRNGEDDDHMVKITGGDGWEFVRGEVWGAESLAAFLVFGNEDDPVGDWRIAESCIHDNADRNDTNQDQLLYVNAGLDAGKGIVERNLIFDAANGSGIKLGGSSRRSGGAANVIVRNNTITDTTQSILVAWESRDNLIEGNLFGEVDDDYGNVRGFRLDGEGNVVTGNAGGPADSLVLNDDGFPGLDTGGDNLFPVDPDFDEVSCDGLRPGNEEAQAFGRWAPTTADQPAPEVTSSPSP